MAIKWTDDYTVIHSMENLTGIAAHTLFGGNVSAEATDTISVQGTNSIAMRVNGNNDGGLAVDPAGGNVDIRGQHITVWMFTMQEYQSVPNDGVQIGLSSVAAATSNVGMMTVGGLETNIGANNNFQSWCIDVNKPFNANTNGTIPALSAVTAFVFLWNFITNNSRISAFIDQSRRGTTAFIKGGTVLGADFGNLFNMITEDLANGFGLFQILGGIYYNLGHFQFGENLIEVTFNTFTGVNGTTEVVTHTNAAGEVDFTTGDEVTYNRQGGTDNIGLPDGSIVYVNVISTTTVSLHLSRAAAIADTARINLTAALTPGETHRFAPNSFFFDFGNAVNFDPQAVAGYFHKWSFVGNQFGFTLSIFGIPVGEGNDAEGTRGTTLKAGGPIPFRLEALDSNMSASFWAVNMQNAQLPMSDLVERSLSHDGTTFVDITRALNSAATSDASVFGTTTPATNDAWYIGYPERFDSFTFTIGTATGGDTFTLAWEYSNGTGWSPLTDLDDHSQGMKTVGTFINSYAIPDAWSKDNTVNSITDRYWIRARVTGGTRTINTPDLSIMSVVTAGGFRMESANVAAVSGLWENMGTIRIRGGTLRKIIITESNAAAKGGAVDLGPDDPPIDTLRDFSIVGGEKGIYVNDFTRFLNAAAAVDKTGGLVGLPSTAHGFVTGQSITVTGTTNYDETYTVDVTTTVNEIVVAATFVAETFATTDTAVPNKTYNLRKIGFSQINAVFRAMIEDISPAAFFQMTGAANDDTVNDVSMYPAVPATSDAFHLADAAPFNEIEFTVGIAGIGTYTNIIEYWNGTAWTAVSGLTDSTNNFKTSGINLVSFTRPTNWSLNDPATLGLAYHLRFRKDAGTMTTNPVSSRIRIPGDVRVDFPATSTVTLNLLEGTPVPMIDNVNGSIMDIVNAPVDTTITVVDVSDFTLIQNAVVLVEASAAGGDLPFNTVITITRITTTATVAHTAHPYKVGAKVNIKGALQSEYNGVKTILTAAANSYTFTVAGSPTTPATGTITANGVVLEGLTDVNGEITDTRSWLSAQPIKGNARKSTGSPLFKTGPIAGTISVIAGFTFTNPLVSDE